MPKCSSPVHMYSGQPLMLPPDAFRVLPDGSLYSYCKPCHMVMSHLSVLQRQGITRTLYVIRRCWEHYWAYQAIKACRAALPPGMAWCIRERRAYPRSAFYTQGKGHPSPWCRTCSGIYALQYQAARRGQRLTWDEASRRYTRSPQRHIKHKQRTAPPGTRWCVDCVAYFALEGLAAWRQKLSRCPEHHQVSMARRRRPRVPAPGKGVAA